MQLIQTVTVGSGGASSIDFTSIPATFTDLYVVVSLRDSQSGSARKMGVKLNSTDPSARTLVGNGSSAASYTDSTYYLLVNGSSATANTFSSIGIYIPNYLSSTNKSASFDYVTETNATDGFQGISAGLYSVTSAVTSISIYSNAAPTGTWVQYSSASLYGIKSGSDGIVTVS